MRLTQTLKCLPRLVQLSGIALGLGIVVRVLERDLAIVVGGLFLVVGVFEALFLDVLDEALNIRARQIFKQ
jgi:hypothetical protein